MSLNPVTPALKAQLRACLPDAVFRPLAPHYLEDPRGRYLGQAEMVLAPGTAEEVAVIVRAAHDARVGLVPFGGGTGLVGAQVMPDGPSPIILSLERMTRIRAVYPTENVLIAEAGAVLASIQDAAEAEDRLFPLSLAAEGSCRIGGNLSTNAGGVNVLRYGNARDLCLGLEVVLPNGRLWNGLTRLRKDNTGYDLRGLLIGAEGTLGVITAAALKLFPRPAAHGTALFGVRDPQAALNLLALLRDRVGEGVSSFELIHRQGLDFLIETGMGAQMPPEPFPDWSVLIELGLGAGQDPNEQLLALFETALERGWVEDGVIAQSVTQSYQIWRMRESIPAANKRIGAISSHDISLPLSEIPRFIPDARLALAEIGDFRVNCFGHLGDGNLHFNVFPPKGAQVSDFEHQRDAVKFCLHDLVVARGGSFSAEHGVGRFKVGDLERYGDPARLAAMRAIKAGLDPHGIMNPGAMLRNLSPEVIPD